MSQATVIRDFMVALGFDVDNAGLGKMQDAMKGVELKAKTLTAALGAMAVGAVIAVRQTASELDKLYFSSQRIGASATNINAFSNAISQMGGSAESAIGTLESLAEKMRNSPGYEGMLGGLGVSTKDANGAMRDRVDVMKDLSGVLAKMPSYQANAYANALGIDQNTLLAMRDGKFVSNMEKYQKIQKELGMDDDLTKSGNEFMTEYRDLTMITKTGFQVIVMQVGKALIPILRLLNTMIQAGIHAFSQLNPQIKEGLAVGLRFGMLTIVLGGFIKTFGLLFKFIPMLKSLIGFVKILRLAFLASPIGIVLALVAAIGLLWDDYRTWKNGGKSLIDWSKWSKEIDFVVGKIKELMEWIDNLIGKVTDGIFGEGTYEGATNWIQDHVINPVKGWFGGEDQKPEEEEKAQIADVNSSELGRKSAEGIANIVKGNTETAQKQNVAANAVLVATQSIVGVAKMVDGGVRGAISGVKNDAYAAFGNLIASGEGDYNSVNRGLVNGKNLGAFKTDLSKMTINQILDRNKLKAGDKNRMNAVGKYQIIATTMKSAIKSMGLSGTEKFTPEMQERIFREFLIPKRKGLNNYLKGGKTSLDQAQYEASMEWASIPVPKGYKTQTGRISDGTSTYYDKNKGNKAKRGHGVHVRDAIANIRNSSNPNLNISRRSINTIAPPNGNPDKSQVNNSSARSQSVVIHQSFKTDMNINGVKTPMETANKVKQQQENLLAFAARNAKSQLA